MFAAQDSQDSVDNLDGRHEQLVIPRNGGWEERVVV